MVKRILVLCLIAFVSVSVAACGDFPPITFLCNIEYQEDFEYDINDVTLNFYYGTYDVDSDNRNYSSVQFGDVRISFAFQSIMDELNDYPKTLSDFLIKEIPHNEFFSEDYRHKNPYYKNEFDNYSHSEMITIPAEFFTEEESAFYFLMLIYENRLDGYKYIRNAKIFYQYNEDTVTITKVETVK